MKKLIRLVFVLFLLWTMDCGLLTANAAVPHLINYQGRLTDTSGVPLNGLYNITFRIYDAENAGNLLWQGTYSSVSISKGVFSILLGDINDSGFNFAALAFDKPYWLEIKVGEDVLSPRQMIASVGYAIRAEKAEQANNTDTVSNIGVSITPAPNKLLPLDNNGQLPATQGLIGNNIVVLSGVISDGATIPLPTGYTESQCKWMVSYANTENVKSAAFDNWLWIKCYTTGRVVMSQTGSTGPGSGPYSTDANYIIIGIK